MTYEDKNVGAGLPAMQTPRYIRQNPLMLSQASQLPHLNRVRHTISVGYPTITSFKVITQYSTGLEPPALRTTNRASGKCLPLTQAIIRLGLDLSIRIRDPRLTPKLLKLEKAAGSVAKRISATRMQQAAIVHILDVAAASLSFTSSASSGNVRTLALGIYEEVSQ